MLVKTKVLATVTALLVGSSTSLPVAQGRTNANEKQKASIETRSSVSLGTPTSNRAFARNYMESKYGWGGKQFSCLNTLWSKESGWKTTAHNKNSGAHGIPQALPGSKMASAGPNWRTNPETQIKWGLNYIDGRYSTPCKALGAWKKKGWY